MPSVSAPDPGTTQAELSVWQAELAEIDRAIERHETFKMQTFVFGTGGVVLLIASAFEAGAGAGAASSPIALLLVAFVCAFLGMFLVDRDEAILSLLQYRETVVKPRVRALVGVDDVLGSYEFFNREAYGTNRPVLRKIARLLTAPFPHALFYVAGAASFGYLLYLRMASARLAGPAWGWALAAAGLALLYAWTGAFLTGGQWAQVGSPPTERGIPFMRRRTRALLPQPDGWSPGDPHAHTNWSDGWRSVWSQAESAVRRSLEWLVLTDHADAVGDDWCGYASALAVVEQRLGVVTLVPGAEVTVVESPDGRTMGDLLVYGWPADGEPPPANRVSPPASVLDRVVARNGAFGVAAHPYNGGAPMSTGFPGTKFGAPAWEDWDAAGLSGLELLSYERTANDDTVERWFALLESGKRVVATGGTDSHMPWTAPGSRGMTWVRASGSGRPDAAEVLANLRLGRAVVSGVGDFGTITIDGAGPGEHVTKSPAGSAIVHVDQRAARGRRCTKVEILGPREATPEGVLRPRVLARTSGGPFEPTFTMNIPGAVSPFVVARFAFADARDTSRWVSEVWTNPVFLRAPD